MRRSAFATGPHRPAVHRVRADAGRRGAGLGLRGADAVADDVLQAAEATSRSHGRFYNAAASACSTALSNGYRARCCRPALRRRPRGRADRRWWWPARQRRAVRCRCKSELAPVEDRGIIMAHRHRARRLDHRLHRPLRQQLEEILPEHPGGRDASSSSSASRRCRRRIVVRPAEGLGRARRASSRRSSPSCSPKLRAHPRRQRLRRSTRRSLGQRGARQAGRVRHPDLAAPTRTCKATSTQMLERIARRIPA